MMDMQRIFEELLTILEANNVKIREELLGGGGGGLCSIKGQWTLFVDTQSPSSEMAEVCAEAVSQVVDIEQIYLKPEIREFIESHNKQEKEY
jgi:hypothetical protein